MAEIKVEPDHRGAPPPRSGGFQWWWLLPLLLIPLLLFMCRGDVDAVPVATDTAAVVPAATPMQTDTASVGATPPIITDTAAGVSGTTGTAAAGTGGANPSDTLIKVDSAGKQ